MELKAPLSHPADFDFFFFFKTLGRANREKKDRKISTNLKSFPVCAVVNLETVRSSCFGTNPRRWTTLSITPMALIGWVSALETRRTEAG